MSQNTSQNINAGFTQSTPLLHPHHVSQTHNLLPPPIRFPRVVHKDRTPSSAPKLSQRSTGGNIEATNEPLTMLSRRKLEGLPKLSRECLISEIQCYGKYIAAVLVVFGVGGVLIAFAISRAWIK